MTVDVARFVTTAVPEDAPARDAYDTPAVAALVAAAREGSREAFGQLVAANQRTVFRAALAALGRVEDAEDAAQEAFVLAWQRLGGFRAESSFRTWLLTITWRRALDRRRARGARWRRGVDSAPDGRRPTDRPDPIDRLEAPDADPERRAVAADLVARTRAAIGALTPKLRDTLLLAASGQYSYTEIAGMLGVPVGTVKWRVAEARRLVRARVPEADHAR